ncbi:MAG: TonB-dependent receptor [Agriterribacter sp.]
MNLRANYRRAFITKTLVIMKTVTLLLFAACLTASAGGLAQRVTLSEHNARLDKVFKEIKKQTGYVFFYDAQVLEGTSAVNVHVKNETIEAVLNEILKEQPLDYSILKKTITIVKKTDARLKTMSSGSPAVVAAELASISGVVKDAQGAPLAGVSVIIKGTTKGTSTGLDGKFSIEANPGDVLEFTIVGYQKTSITVGRKKDLTVLMEIEAAVATDIVVVGYGTQKKSSLTGAIEQVGSEVFENRSIPNATQGLQGVIPNLNISLADGKPTRSAAFQVRGVSSIGQGGSALVLIDGVEGDPAMLNPNDIASVSVLKDAGSAAIYGARGAFGVVLITTKNPKKGRTSINYSTNFSIKSPTVVPDMVTDSYLYANMFVEAYSAFYDYARTPVAFHKAVPYSQAWHDEMAQRRPGSGKPEVETDANGMYQYYANTDWYDLLYKDRSFGNDHNISIQGATDKAAFMISGRYYKQDGVFNYNSDDYTMYNLRAKGSAQIFDWLKAENNLEVSNMKYFNPLTVADVNVWYGLESEAEPMSPLFNPDGTLTLAAAYSVGDLWYGKSGTNSTKRVLRNTTSFSTSFLNDMLRFKADFTFRNADNGDITRRVPVPYSSQVGVIGYLGTSTDDLSETNANTKYLATNIYGEFEKTFNDAHYFKAMMGYNYEQSTYNSLFSSRNGLMFPDANNINFTNGSRILLANNYEKWRIAGGFSRLNYAFKDRYLLEVNARLDGSTKFPVNQQWGFFPSVSAGWRISKENFWKVSDKALSDVKLRVSYGSLGNGTIASYQFRELLYIKQMQRLVSEGLGQYTMAPEVLPDGLTWETSTTANLGLDFNSLNGRLRFSGDAYIRKTTDMFAVGLDLPGTFGAAAPKGNYADMTTKGWELTLRWRDEFALAGKPFNYNVRFTLADYVSKIDKYTNIEKALGVYNDARVDYYEGMTLGEVWGYVTEGFFTSEADIAAHASQSRYFASNTGKWLPGDIKFADLNKDGVIDYGTNKVNDPGDRKVIGNTTPRYTYGIGLNADWSGIFVSAFFQGVGKQDWWPGTDNALFWGQYNRPYNNIPTSMIGNIWSEENPNAYFPRYRGYVALQGTRELSVVQTRYLQNVAYVRLKNLQIGYNLPQSLVSRAKMKNASVFLSAENLWSWSPLYKRTKNFDVANIYGQDQEAQAAATNNGVNTSINNGGQIYNYPTLKSISIGLSVTF